MKTRKKSRSRVPPKTRILVVGADHNLSTTIICMRAKFGPRGAIFCQPEEITTPEDIPQDVGRVWISDLLSSEEQQRLTQCLKQRGIASGNVVVQQIITTLHLFLNSYLPTSTSQVFAQTSCLVTSQQLGRTPIDPKVVGLDEFIAHRVAHYDQAAWLEPKTVLQLARQIGILNANLPKVKLNLEAHLGKEGLEQLLNPPPPAVTQPSPAVSKPRTRASITRLREFVKRHENTDLTAAEQAGWIYDQAIKVGIENATKDKVNRYLYTFRRERRKTLTVATAADHPVRTKRRSRFTQDEIERVYKGFTSE